MVCYSWRDLSQTRTIFLETLSSSLVEMVSAKPISIQSRLGLVAAAGPSACNLTHARAPMRGLVRHLLRS